ncbi:MAG: hypothetical protein IKB25_05520 [Lentisphaeria bacterium]|nr:hypothetical protein [Lentisphaeria bacterium]
MEDIYEPLELYRSELKDKFASVTAERFQNLLKQSRVDEAANQKLVNQIDRLNSKLRKMSTKQSLWMFLNIVFIVGAVVGIVMLFKECNEHSGLSQDGLIGIAVAVFCCLLFFLWSLPAYRDISSRIERLTAEIRQKKDEAWAQVQPLLNLFTWDMPADLTQETYPEFKFDPYFTTGRLADMKLSYDWNDEFNEERSVVYSHSGEIRGNPFVLAETKQMYWDTKVYTGSKTIYWKERVRDSEGKMQTVNRSETLYASVSKPIPAYNHDKFLLYGNEAAPNLTFRRGPSEHSASGDGFFAKWGKKRETEKLRELARNLNDDIDFTMMSNEEFEVLFHAIDRNHEIEFRLLFTALAQQQMVKLLNDTVVGFGDDFSFTKAGKMNMIQAGNQRNIEFVTSPDQFSHYSVRAIRNLFQTKCEAFFKSFYFSLAPLLTIPLYQHSRSIPQKDFSKWEHRVSFWEFESVANYYGDGHFKHSSCSTQNILKVTNMEELSDGSSAAVIRAHGFREKQRVDYVSVYGGDGRYHDVAVEWLEYLPVYKDTKVLLIDEGNPESSGRQNRIDSVLEHWKRNYDEVIYFRKLFACIVK